MKIPRCLTLLSVLLFVASEIGADPPPDKSELNKLLKAEPINTANWAKWSPRLRAWSGEYFEAASPAFQRGFTFIKSQHKAQGDNVSLPRPLDKDAMAWMLLAGAYVHESKPELGKSAMARRAQAAARRSLQLDPDLARAHFLLCRAIRREQLTPPTEGGPDRPDRNRLSQALEALKKARELDPRAKFYSSKDAAYLAAESERWDVAETFLRVALQDTPGDVEIARVLARAINDQLSPRYQRKGAFADAVKPLVEQFPSDGGVVSHYALAFLRDRNYTEAARQVARARELGADPVQYIGAGNLRQIEEGEAHNVLVSAPLTVLQTIGTWAMWFGIFYGGLMLLMCIGGLVLARFTRGPRAAAMLGKPPEELAAAGSVLHTSHESWLKRIYLFILLLALILFYLSLPFVFLGMLLLLLVALVVALCVSKHKDADNVQGALLCASGGGISAVFKAVFAKVGTGGFGLRMTRRDCPRLWDALEDVADRVDTDPVNEVWLAPGSDFGVHQEGRGPFGVFGGKKRVLTIGLCVLDVLTLDEFKAILAHEYAHFSHADTFWSRFLFQVTLSLRTAMQEMARTGGWIAYINPFYWFFWLYSKSYSLLGAGFSRSHEFLADRMACTLYGSDVFARALRKVCTDGVHFEMVVYENIARLLRNKKAYVNMYLAFRKHREEKMTDEERRRLHRDLLDDKPSVFRSHPTFKERMEAARQLPMARASSDTPAIGMFDDPEQIERELTDFLTDVIHHHMRA
jgi:Zn-dependent protease with chaperone function